MGENFSKINVCGGARTELHDALNLTGAEISINELPKGAGVPFVHSHKQNEEIYGILEGQGVAEIDRQKITLSAGDWIRISPAAKRQFSATADSAIKYVCIQVKAGSLENYTAADAEIY